MKALDVESSKVVDLEKFVGSSLDLSEAVFLFNAGERQPIRRRRRGLSGSRRPTRPKLLSLLTSLAPELVIVVDIVELDLDG
jgi:hypothetical protein